MIQTPEAVIAFWEDAGPSRWFGGGEAFDAQCREALLDLHLRAARAELSKWADTAQGSLALILLLDQIPRNVFRGSAHAYATDPMALSVAALAMQRGHDREFALELRSFFYLPLMHSEAPEHQDQCVAIFQNLKEAASAPWAQHHCDIIRRFGRFPHRNHLLGRESTAEEQEWLDAGGFNG